MKASALIEVLQGMMKEGDDPSVRVTAGIVSKPITGAWRMQYPKKYGRHILLSTGEGNPEGGCT